MFNIECLLKEILNELKTLNKFISVRANTIKIFEIDTSDTNKHIYYPYQIFGTDKNFLCTQLNIIDGGGGFYINVNNSGTYKSGLNFSIINEEIKNFEIQGSGISGTGKIRLGGTI